jgi:hypothetical protein
VIVGEKRPEYLYVPLAENESFSVDLPLLRWCSFAQWRQHRQIALPTLMTTDFKALKEVFSRYFFASPKSKGMIHQQDIWRVDIVEEMAKACGGVFNPIIASMKRENIKRLEMLDHVRLLDLFDAPVAMRAHRWLKVRPFTSHDSFPNLKPVEVVDQAPEPLQEGPYLKGLFGPKRMPMEDLYESLFHKTVNQTNAPASWVSYTTLSQGSSSDVLWGSLDPNQVVEILENKDL